MSQVQESRKVGRQNRQPKSRFNLRWDQLNYDFLCRLALERGVSIAVIANDIVRKARFMVPCGTPKTS